MESIRLLDDNTINKIAAGEVVERPSSVIKELLENSIDARATAITIEIAGGGKFYIRITDNGIGINREDIELAFLRHSTSKISQAEDLCCIETLGFRGEALASISAVSQVELITKTSRDEVGIKALVHGGTLKSKEDIGCPNGTTMIIRNLFYNTPVRQKFLKSDSTEASYIGDIVYKLAISNPGISFNYIKDNKPVIKTPGRGDLKTTAYSILGGDFVDSTFEIENTCDGMSLNGFIGKPEYTRSNRNAQYLFINGRYIKDSEISKTIEQSYSTLLTVKRYPVSLLFINVETEKVDINVHPTKTEVRFTNRDIINKFLMDSIKNVLYSENLIPKVTFSEPVKKVKKQVSDSEEQVILDVLPNKSYSGASKKDNDETYIESIKRTIDRIDKIDKLDDLGNVDTIVKATEVPDAFKNKSFPIVDRILHDKDLNKYKELLQVIDFNLIDDDKTDVKKLDIIDGTIEKTKKVVFDKGNSEFAKEKEVGSDKNKEYKNSNTEVSEATCTLYDDIPIIRVPEIVVIGSLFKTYILGQDIKSKVFYMIDQHAAHERIMYEKLKDEFLSQGVSTQMLIATDVLELSLSDMELIKNNIEVFKDLGFEIEDFGTNTIALRGVPLVFGKPNSKKLFLDILDNLDSGPINNYELQLERIMKLACTSAIKANDSLDDIEVDKLIRDLRQTEEPFTCPHGRPIIIEMTKSEIEKKFKRT